MSIPPVHGPAVYPFILPTLKTCCDDLQWWLHCDANLAHLCRRTDTMHGPGEAEPPPPLPPVEPPKRTFAMDHLAKLPDRPADPPPLPVERVLAIDWYSEECRGTLLDVFA